MGTKQQPIIVTPIEGHIILYCKGRYEYENFFEGLKMIWAIRCGYNYENTSSDTLTFIAMDMYKILQKTQPNRMDFIMEQVHRNIVPKWKGDFIETLSPIKALIWNYREHLSNMIIRETDKATKKLYTLVKLPKPKPQVFNRILRGNGRYKDYELITK